MSAKKKKIEIYINPVKDNKDKYITYTELNKRRNIALNNNNYIEVISYDYSMIEDRLLSILKYLNIIELRKNGYIIKESIKNDFYMFYYKEDDKTHNDPKINNISTKYNILSKLLKYKAHIKVIEDISLIIKEIEKELSLKKTIDQLKKWCDKRNEITHALYNKNIIDLDNKLKDIALEGKELSYKFNKICNQIKKL